MIRTEYENMWWCVFGIAVLFEQNNHYTWKRKWSICYTNETDKKVCSLLKIFLGDVYKFSTCIAWKHGIRRPISKMNLLVLFGHKISVCGKNNTKHVSILSAQNVDVLSVKQMFPTVTTVADPLRKTLYQPALTLTRILNFPSGYAIFMRCYISLKLQWSSSSKSSVGWSL